MRGVVLIVAAVLWLFTLLVWVGGYRFNSTGRFVPVTPNAAVDTQSGRLCWTYDPIGGSDKIPLCKDIR